MRQLLLVLGILLAVSPALAWNPGLADWDERRPVVNSQTTGTWTNGTQFLTLDWDSFLLMQADCDDMVVTDAVNGDAVLAYSWVNRTSLVIGCGTHNMTVMVRRAVTANNTFYVYSGNAAAADNSTADVWSPEVLAFWPLMGDTDSDNTGPLQDVSGTGNPFVLSAGGVAFHSVSPDDRHSSFRLDGSTYLSSTYVVESPAYTSAVWIKKTTPNAFSGFVLGNGCGSPGYASGWMISWNDDTPADPYFNFGINPGGAACTIEYHKNLTYNEWHFIGLMNDGGSNIYAIFDGTLTSQACTNAQTWDGHKFTVGARSDGWGDFTGYASGAISIDRVLNQSEIYALMNATRPVDSDAGLSEVQATAKPLYYNWSVSPASPQPWPLSSVSFNITWSPETEDVYIMHNATGTSVKYPMSNASSGFTWRYQLNDPAVGTVQYVFYGNATDGLNQTAVAYYVVTPTAPRWSLPFNISSGPAASFGATWTAGSSAVDTSWIEANITGAYLNYSGSVLNMTTLSSTLHRWRGLANSTGGLWNSTPWHLFRMYYTAPAVPLNETARMCLDADTLGSNEILTFCEGADCYNYRWETNTTCDTGCNAETNECNPPGWVGALVFAALVTGLVTVLILVWRWLS